MVETINVKGYEAFRAAVKDYDQKKQLIIYFTGEKTNGMSWCSDCNYAESHVMTALQEYVLKDSIFLIVDVGDRAFWKDLKNPFRLDNDVKISTIPTLIRWNEVERLECEQCKKPELLEMFFTENESEY